MQSQIKVKPFLKWVGGKSQLLPEILRHMPRDYDRYFEPFLGGGAVFFSLQQKKACLIDINAELINTYLIVRDHVDELIADLKNHIYSKEYYYFIRSADRSLDYQNWDSIQKASRFIYLNKTCYNGLYRVNSKQEFNSPMGSYKNPKIVDEKSLRACSQALLNVELIHDNFLAIEYMINSKDIVYLDPPYAPLTKTASFTSYTPDRFDADKQVELYKFCCRLNDRGIRFMLSNSSASSILDLYGQEKSFKIEFVQATRFINSHGDKRGKISEVIVTNYEY